MRSIPVEVVTKVGKMDQDFLLKKWRFPPPKKPNFDGDPDSRHIAVVGAAGDVSFLITMFFIFKDQARVRSSEGYYTSLVSNIKTRCSTISLLVNHIALQIL